MNLSSFSSHFYKGSCGALGRDEKSGILISHNIAKPNPMRCRPYIWSRSSSVWKLNSFWCRNRGLSFLLYFFLSCLLALILFHFFLSFLFSMDFSLCFFSTSKHARALQQEEKKLSNVWPVHFCLLNSCNACDNLIYTGATFDIVLQQSQTNWLINENKDGNVRYLFFLSIKFLSLTLFMVIIVSII